MSDFFACLHFFLAFYLRLFFLFTPFFVLSSFLAMTEDEALSERRRLAISISKNAAAVCLLIFLFGVWIMQAFGITVAAFRAGSGALLMLSAVSLVYGDRQKKQQNHESLSELALVPLAVPVTAGPATLGALMVSGMDTVLWSHKFMSVLAIIAASATIGIMLYYSGRIEEFIGRPRITVLSKVTGLILSAIAMQMLVAGVCELWFGSLP
ncbi:MAG: MarC family protein [Oligosphaeraceae bacterium]|nr:MarC family protein [Oligosphaeraceae bacterium]